VVGLIGKPLLYIVAIVAGVLVSAAAVSFAKSIKKSAVVEAEAAEEQAGYPATGTVPSGRTSTPVPAGTRA
jgi:PTS system fructose-specific IIC component